MATIEIDGKTFEAENGKMIIEVADDAGIYIPRFCYHKKLSVAANCRMCLVEVENGRKPVPACATPITNGMKVFTKSEEALRSQKAVMEFLLINHPLDCPICDQGGECELQDISMGFGEDSSEYIDTKRSVDDDDLGPLISTEMTRCIHCTRCVRFGDEVAGVRELGATGRGEHMQIGTYVKHSLTSEVSGNVIDLCPVGALTSKPYRFTARAWEMTQHETISPHDCLGTNLYAHVRRNRLMRMVPRENESINETWISDRDRYSYLGINSKKRALEPKIKKNGQWEPVDWETALKFAADGLARVIKHHGGDKVAAFSHPSSTLEEHYLLQKLMRGVGVANLDHRLQQVDFRDESFAPLMPESTTAYDKLESMQAILLVGCHVHREVPLAGVRIRKAWRNGASIMSINPADFDFHFETDITNIVSPSEMAMELARVLVSLIEDKSTIPEELQRLLIGIEPDQASDEMARLLSEGSAAIVSGALVENHPDASVLRTLIASIRTYSGADIVRLTNGGNSAGAWLSGMIPHRASAGKTQNEQGLNVQQAIEARLKAYVLLGCDPAYDFAQPKVARDAMLGAEFVIMLSAFMHDGIEDHADVILPIATFAETAGTYININQLWQTVQGCLQPQGEARPAWKVLRVLGNLLHVDGFEYIGCDEILEEIRTSYKLSHKLPESLYWPLALPEMNQGIVRLGEWPLYRCDPVVRHAEALQQCASADMPCIRLHPQTADRLKLNDVATIAQGDIEITLPLKRDDRMATDVVWVANAMPETADLGHSFAAITIKR